MDRTPRIYVIPWKTPGVSELEPGHPVSENVVGAKRTGRVDISSKTKEELIGRPRQPVRGVGVDLRRGCVVQQPIVVIVGSVPQEGWRRAQYGVAQHIMVTRRVVRWS